MKVKIISQFDKRDVGTIIDIHKSVANSLIEKGFVSENLEKELQTIKKAKKNGKM